MYQKFEDECSSAASAERFAALRVLMAKSGLNGVLIPRTDEHQGEYVAACSERLAWLTGFSGSAGLCAVLERKAALFVDGRYTVQSRQQVDQELMEIHQVPDNSPSDWLCDNLESGAILGFDPWLHTINEIDALKDTLQAHGIRLKPVARNLVDQVWGSARPKPPCAPIIVQPLKYAGQGADTKIESVRKELLEAGQDAAILTLPDAIAWLFNIRGSDVAHNPVALAFAIVPARGKPELFVDPAKLTSAAVKSHLKAVARLRLPKELNERVRALARDKRVVRVDPNTTAHWFGVRLGRTKSTLAYGRDPCLWPKSRKNSAEIKGARAAHERDGVAMVRFLAWLDREALRGKLDEITAVKQLEAFRAETGALREVSFDTISGSGPNGAIVHYRVTTASNRRLRKGELFLVDSGAQYHDGTTDITRTIAIGRPSAEMRERFTLVLKGHIAIATARFPQGTRGVDLDPLARAPLWAHGLDFDHGTGHGVGSYLSVHEGPQSLSRRGMVKFEPGMIVSNEPGYYKENAYGIRIENLLLVSEATDISNGERPMLGFETLTLAPIDRRLVAVTLLETGQRRWLNAYHARVRDAIGPELDATDRAWLNDATTQI